MNIVCTCIVLHLYVPTQVVPMAHSDAYHKYLEKLVKCLPMDDTHFITKLSSQKLLPGDTDRKINALSTEPEKARYFLNHVIKPALDIDNISNFDKLLSVMQNCDYSHVENLATNIKHEIDKPDEVNSHTSGKHLLILYGIMLVVLVYVFNSMVGCSI